MERDSQNRGESSRRPSAKDWALGLGMGIRKRLLGDPAGISYGAADFPYASTATPSLLHSRQEQMVGFLSWNRFVGSLDNSRSEF
mmetsp:Transcript_19842/g.79125  ORF Transcript_19842/g.79125 Transcript_19842/m.79125 type:complete len:85 (+) Transcript_19842:175-429(+)